MPNDSIIFYGGLIVAGAALIAGVIAAVTLSFRRKILMSKLDSEYGRKRR
jgi:hypothetical protein